MYPVFSFLAMSRGHTEHGNKFLDTIFWLNEVTGEITYPPAITTLETPVQGPSSVQWDEPESLAHAQVPCSAPKPRAPLMPPPRALQRDIGLGRGKTVAPQSSMPFSAMPVTLSPPGEALQVLGSLGPGVLPQASCFAPSVAAASAFSCKQTNVLTCSDCFSF